MIAKYEILGEEGIGDLAREVSSAVLAGWEPVGGPFAWEGMICQAVALPGTFPATRAERTRQADATEQEGGA